MLSRRQLLLGTGAVALAPPGLGAYAVGIEPMLPPRITRYRIVPKGWPEGVTLRIAAIADLHACEPFMSAARIRGIALTANALDPDLIVLLGDFNGGHRMVSGIVTPAAWGDALSVLQAPLGTYAILGNHDWWHGPIPDTPGGAAEVRAGLRGARIPVLENEAVPLEKDGRRIWLAGLADQMAYRTWGHGPRGADDLPGTLRAIGDEAPVIVLMHEPYLFPHMPDRVGLALCGHTHGGQVRLPLLGAPFTVSRDYQYGHITHGDRHLVVSGGLGESGFPARLGMPPEIVEVTIG